MNYLMQLKNGGCRDQTNSATKWQLPELFLYYTAP